MPQGRGKSVAEIAHKFSFVEHQPAPSSPLHTQREDALSAATSARFANVSSQGQAEDYLVQRSRLGSNSVYVESAPPAPPFPQVFIPPAPPPPPAFVPPPPPPPPPVVPPSERVILRRKPTKKDKDRKKRDSGSPQLSMAEVVAKARKMREQRERVLSTGSGGASATTSGGKEASEDPFESAMQARVGQLKSRRVEVQQAPRQEEDSELMREMRKKAQRASRAFVESEKPTHLSVDDNVFFPENDRRSSRDNSSTSSREAGDNDSLQSLENTERLESPKQVKDFVDSLFDPVLSQGVEGLSDEVALQGALKGGGGVNQPNTAAANASAATTSTAPAINGHPTGQAQTQGNGYAVHPTVQAHGNGYAVQGQGNGYPGMIQANGFPGMMPGAPMYYSMPQTNGPLMGLPHASNGPVMGAAMFPATNMDAAMLAAQQQVLIERLIAQQALLQQQQTVASQKQQDQLLMLAQQQQSQLEQMQHILTASQSAAPQQLDSQTADASSFSTTSAATNGHVVSHNGETTVEVPSPPLEFSDVGHSLPPHSPLPVPSPLILIPPRSSSLPPPPPPMPEQVSSVSEAFPPPPPAISEDRNAALDNVDAPQRPGLTRRVTDKVALAVAALEGNSGAEESPRSPGPASPLKHTDSFSFVINSPARRESSAKERPDLHKQASSALGFVVLSDKQNTTILHPRSTGPYLSYNHAKWKLNIRKEVSWYRCY